MLLHTGFHILFCRRIAEFVKSTNVQKLLDVNSLNVVFKVHPGLLDHIRSETIAELIQLNPFVLRDVNDEYPIAKNLVKKFLINKALIRKLPQRSVFLFDSSHKQIRENFIAWG